MLRDLYVAAWVKSAEPVQDWHDQHENAAPSTPNPTASTTTVQQPSGKDPFHSPFPEGMTNPTLRFASSPEYSEEARRAGTQGIVVLHLVVDAQGGPHNVRVIRSLGMGLDEKAIEAVRQYRFNPATYEGHPVPVQINIEVNFRLYRRGD